MRDGGVGPWKCDQEETEAEGDVSKATESAF